jgi:hypothetical protein
VHGISKDNEEQSATDTEIVWNMSAKSKQLKEEKPLSNIAGEWNPVIVSTKQNFLVSSSLSVFGSWRSDDHSYIIIEMKPVNQRLKPSVHSLGFLEILRN